MKTLYLMHDDLRFEDNEILEALVQKGDPVQLLYILDPGEHLEGSPAWHLRIEILERLRRRVGDKLAVRVGDTAEILRNLGAAYDRIITQRVLDPDRRQALGATGLPIQEIMNQMVVDVDRIFTGAGTPYKVFTYYYNQWRAYDPFLAKGTVEDLELIDDLSSDRLPPVEVKVVDALLDTYHRFDAGMYASGRDEPSEEATSHASALLATGYLSPLRVLADHGQSEAYRRQIAWRDFYLMVLYHFPHVKGSAFNDRYGDVHWWEDEKLFEAWKTGRTGYPFVDAGMRQLLEEGYMHNRLRMVVASFLTKDLHIHWREGEAHFFKHLYDANVALNNGGWQWAASTGADAQPYFRIFNPVSQGKKHDPQGTYIRRFVPELADLPTKYLHEPWKIPEKEQEHLGVVIGRDYPAPIVEHKLESRRAKTYYKKSSEKKADDR